MLALFVAHSLTYVAVSLDLMISASSTRAASALLWLMASVSVPVSVSRLTVAVLQCALELVVLALFVAHVLAWTAISLALLI